MIRQVLTFPVLIDAIEAAHRRPKIEIRDTLLSDQNNHYFVRDAVDRGRFMGSKLITSFPSNLATGKLPAVQAVSVLFDGTNGSPLAVLDGTEITYWRTAANSAVGAKLLAPKSPETLLIVGAGAMAPWLVRAHRTVRPSLRRVFVWNRTYERAERVATELIDEGVPAEAVRDLDATIALADVISSCTRSHSPLIKGAEIRPGSHLDLVGGYTEGTREADDDAVKRALLFVDRWESAFAGVGDILQPIASGAITKSHVRGDLYDLINGRSSGRHSSDDITIYKNAGGGHFDLIAAETIFRQVSKTLIDQ